MVTWNRHSQHLVSDSSDASSSSTSRLQGGKIITTADVVPYIKVGNIANILKVIGYFCKGQFDSLPGCNTNILLKLYMKVP